MPHLKILLGQNGRRTAYVYITTPSSKNSLWHVFVNWGVASDIRGRCASPAYSVTLSAVFFFFFMINCRSFFPSLSLASLREAFVFMCLSLKFHRLGKSVIGRGSLYVISYGDFYKLVPLYSSFNTQRVICFT